MSLGSKTSQTALLDVYKRQGDFSVAIKLYRDVTAHLKVKVLSEATTEAPAAEPVAEPAAAEALAE